ncbi:MAG: UDP-glucose/GDP-mannose dehydrogenase family protein [Clostridiales Family XIII bacterium]|jgi:UDPglucose 6-dehydrogenase|nr:UDP-glucose/GDP-mannose dehydrogenase family protein [Clostridiales Family XIII bacterium]
MKITVIGTGYVGLVTGACFAEMGNDVLCVDLDKEKIEALNEGEMPIYEPGLETMVKENAAQGRIGFAIDVPASVAWCDVCFIAVGTPRREDGSADLRHVLRAAEDIGRSMTKPICVVDKSTVPVGTAAKVRAKIREELAKRGVEIPFAVVSNPEFLKEGSAVSDCMKPDRVVIGSDDAEAVALMKELYAPFVMNTENFIVMDAAGAEMTKYAANAMLATKISFMNEIANICERVGADVNKVRIGIGSDPRIGYRFIYPGCGYGGSCFPKDVEALIGTAEAQGYTPALLKAVGEVNERQKRVIPQKIKERFGEDLRGRKFAVWGLSFKPDTDDMRESASITVMDELEKAGAEIVAYDPRAMREAKRLLGENERIRYAKSKYEAIRGADAMILITEWKEFRSPDFYEMREHMKTRVVFDGRNQYDAKIMEKHGFEYYQIGVGRPSGEGFPEASDFKEKEEA